MNRAGKLRRVVDELERRLAERERDDLRNRERSPRKHGKDWKAMPADQSGQHERRRLRSQLGHQHRPARAFKAGVELALVDAESDGNAAGGDTGGVSERLAVQRGDESWSDRLETLDHNFTQATSWFLTGGSDSSSNSLARTQSPPKLPRATECAISGFLRRDHDLPELITIGHSLERLSAALERKDAVDNRQQPSRRKLCHHCLEFGVVAHGRPHDAPLIPEETPHVGSHHRA